MNRLEREREAARRMVGKAVAWGGWPKDRETQERMKAILNAE